MLSVFDVANYFLTLGDDSVGEGITNLKMQKLCYYAQGYHLALYGKRLFDNDIEAWIHGPVVPELYTELKRYGINPIPYPLKGKTISLDEFSSEEKDLLDKIYVEYAQYSAWMLRNMTHEDNTPWKKAKEKHTKLINDQDMKEYFQQNNEL